ncbi:hypothetical protein [Pseudoalteromonas aurantia]|uniref:Bacterial Ig-like domain-containing protein n=1 Tax=Pseudoalteromonas aurantia TaxID=43654 RepID=A0A5S3VDG9_9GAMM|nr:hypothetical protein [Pseudoalteromonas aurantia]TMO69990.1 hypothetical protein CWC19_03070 [Pseudoalteromonas aurantia]TMO75948.1 hypothetical protein CWC20_06750 [Pseudoalteromonas aurantia]
MKLLKKALLATAIVGTFGANAATVSSTPVKLSAEGVAAKKSAADVPFDVDFVIAKETAAASKIVLTFDAGVSVSDLADALDAGSENVINDPNTGKGTIYDDGQTTGTKLVEFDYGTGSFTFDKFKANKTANTIEFVVNLGNPLTANSAFRMSFEGAAGVDFVGAANVAYKSSTTAGVEIETGTGVLATTESQFSFKVSQPYNGLIERLEKKTFSKKGDDSTDAGIDALKLTFNDKQTKLQAALIASTNTVELTGNFSNGGATTGTITNTENSNFAVSASGTAALSAVGSAVNQKLTISLPDAAITNAGVDSPITVTYDSGQTKVIPVTGAITAKVTATITNASGTPSIVIADSVDAGKWALDATVINIPYFPVGFTGLSTSVHFANESANKANVLVSAIDTDGKEYSGSLTDLAGNTVTKVSQGTIMTALGLESDSSYKLSVTFNIDANTGDVNAYAFSNAGDARQALVTSQEKGSDK